MTDTLPALSFHTQIRQANLHTEQQHWHRSTSLQHAGPPQNNPAASHPRAS